MNQPDKSKKDGSSESNQGSDSSNSSQRSNGAAHALRKAMRDVAPYLDLGWRLAGSTAFPPLLGYGLDLWLNTLPWGLLVGCVLGLSAAVVQLRRLQQELGA